jgi:hypothetical protein
MYQDITSYELACKAEGIDPIASIPFQNPADHNQVAVNSFAKSIIVRRALNRKEDASEWKPNWQNYNEKKWGIVWDMDAERQPSGFGFRYSCYGYAYAFTYLGSRQRFRTDAIAKHYVKYFTELDRDVMVIPE